MPSCLRWPVLPEAAPLDLSYPCPGHPCRPAASAISGHRASLARVGRFQDAALRIAVAVFPAATAGEGVLRRRGAGGSRRGQTLLAGCHQLLLASGGPGWWEEGAAIGVILGSRPGVPSPSPWVGAGNRGRAGGGAPWPHRGAAEPGLSPLPMALPTMIFSAGAVPLVHTWSLTKDPSNFP